MRRLRIALLGSRGVPARYGGFETLYAELAPRLIARGFDVTIYARAHYLPRGRKRYRGARIVALPAIRSKHLETPTHTLLSCLHAISERFDAALMVNAANAVFLPLLRAGGIPVALNVDGIEKRRAKWGVLGRWVYAVSERLATTLPDALVTDAESIAQHYLARYGASSTILTYGVDTSRGRGNRALRQLGLKSREYFLYVSRFEPENNPHRVAAAYRKVPGNLPLVMVGTAPYAQKFIASFRNNADPRILFPGPIYGRAYRQLLRHCLAYIQATEVGGTHPALVEAMGSGAAIVAHDTPEHREVVGDAAWIVDVHDSAALARAMSELARSPELAASLRKRALERARSRYDWEPIAEGYAQLLRRLAGEAASSSEPC